MDTNATVHGIQPRVRSSLMHAGVARGLRYCNAFSLSRSTFTHGGCALASGNYWFGGGGGGGGGIAGVGKQGATIYNGCDTEEDV